MSGPGPGGLRLVADRRLSRWRDGRVLLGGSPPRVVRLSGQGARLVDGWLRGEPVAARHAGLAERLLLAGMVHPRPGPARLGAADVTVVIPARDPAGPLPEVPEVARTVLVDDGSVAPLPGAAVRHTRPRGPAAARNSGWRVVTTEVVAFLDADVQPCPGWLVPLLAHFEDPAVVAVAPRIRSLPGPSLLSRYERMRGPHDQGPSPAPIGPGGRISFVPSAALLVRTRALAEAGGFDERLRFGEDVDLVWRLSRIGRLRYEPAALVLHTPRTRWGSWLRQRFGYGSAAAPLARRHGSAVAPVRISAAGAAAWLALGLRRPLTGALIAAVAAAPLPGRLARAGLPREQGARLVLAGHLGTAEQLADAITRSWSPLALPALAATGWGRALLLAAYARHVRDWWRRAPLVDLPRWLVLRAVDDLAYGAGVWAGAARHRTVRPLLPQLLRRSRSR